MVTVFGCSMHLACFNGLTDHEFPLFWDFKKWPWWQESNGMLSNLLYQVLWLSEEQKFEHSELFVRLPMCIMAQICLFLTYKLGNALAREMGSSCPLGLYGSFMLAVNCSFLAHSFHCRFYMLNMVLVLITILLLVRACRQRTWLNLFLYLLAVCGCIGTMLLSAIIVVPSLVYYILSAPNPRLALKQGILVAVASLAFFVLLVAGDQFGFQRFKYMADDDTLGLILCLGYMGCHYVHPALESGVSSRNVWDNCDPTVWGVTIVSVVAFILVGWQLFKTRRGWRLTPLWLCPLILVWTVVFFAAFSALVKFISLSPNYSWCLPFWGLVFGQALCSHRWWRYIMLSSMIVAIPFTHISFLVGRTSPKDIAVTLMHQRQHLDPITLSCSVSHTNYLRKYIGYIQEIQGDGCDYVAKAWMEESAPLHLHRNQTCHLLDQVLRLHRVKPQRLWILDDDISMRQSRLDWLGLQEQQQRLSFTVTKRYPLDMYCITLLPCANGKAVLQHPAPTPLRGHSALKYLQQCR